MFLITCVHPNPEYPPLALGLCHVYAKQRLDKNIFHFNRTLIHKADDFASLKDGLIHIFLFSNYIWNTEKNMKMSNRAKLIFPNSITIHGGPNIPIHSERCKKFLINNPNIDYAVRGEGEDALVDLLQTLLLKRRSAENATTGGVSAIIEGDFVHNPLYEDIRNLDKLPSPYLSDFFSGEAVDRWEAATIETNRGCPYSCVYCGWGLKNKVYFFDLERIFAEIDWIVLHKIETLWIADANFGIHNRDLDIAKYICAVKERTGFPKRVVANYSKNIHRNMIEIVKLFTEFKMTSTGVISLQTRDEKTLSIVGRKNIKTTEYDKLQEVFAADSLPMATQLMIGLPGSTKISFEDDLRYYFDRKIEVQIFRTIMLFNSAMADPAFQTQHGIVIDGDGLVVATNTITENQFVKMTQLARVFQAVNSYGILRYIVIWLHHDHGIDPINLLSSFVEDIQPNGKSEQLLFELLEIEANPIDLLATHLPLREELRTGKKKWVDLASEFCGWALSKYAIEPGEDLRVVIAVQTALMPRQLRSFPETVEVTHDIVKWYKDQRNGCGMPLLSYGPGMLTIEDPFDISNQPLMRNMPGRSRTTWELQSELAEGLPRTI